MAYRSNVDIKLGESPKTTEVELLPDMIDIYNAIHILNQYLDAVAGSLNTRHGDPWETMAFQHYLELPAYNRIEAGHAVTLHNGTFRRGWKRANIWEEHVAVPYYNDSPGGDAGPGWWSASTAYVVRREQARGELSGIATNDAEPGELVSVAIGPGVLEIEPVPVGTIFMAYPWGPGGLGVTASDPIFPSFPWWSPPNIPGTPNRPNDGNIYRYVPPGVRQYVDTGWAVGFAITPTAMYVHGDSLLTPLGEVQRIERRR